MKTRQMRAFIDRKPDALFLRRYFCSLARAFLCLVEGLGKAISVEALALDGAGRLTFGGGKMPTSAPIAFVGNEAFTMFGPKKFRSLASFDPVRVFGKRMAGTAHACRAF